MENYIKVGNLQVAEELYNFVNKEAIPGTGIDQDKFWSGFESIISDLAPKNKALLAKRDELQSKIDEYHKANKGKVDPDKYSAFLSEIGYLEPMPGDFEITTSNVDDEIAKIAGPQLVVPVNNARYALNAVNARWGSLYDALYGSNIIDEDNGKTKSGPYNEVRGQAVVEFAKKFLDEYVPLASGSHLDVTEYTIKNGKVEAIVDGKETPLKDEAQFVGYTGSEDKPSSILFIHNDLHIEIVIDPTSPIGKADKAGVKDVVLESAITTIMDCEDSVAAVDAEDKVVVYENWLGLMKGNLEATFKKGDKTVVRTPNAPRVFKDPSGKEFSLNGRVLMLVRNVGHLMTNPAILTPTGDEIPEGIMDGVITSLIALHDLKNTSDVKNSKKGSVYIVKPKMHGSEEAAFANEIFDRVENLLGLEPNTLKIGVMDEERRTSVNLLPSIEKVKNRIVFINTGFLDRTGDEMHTSMEAGPMIRKADMKNSTWLTAYEKSNVASGLKAGFKGKAQIGKGMWAMPDLMKEMIDQKGGQLQAGANTAWVPSPTAGTLHAIHYHVHSVPTIQSNLKAESKDYRPEILTIPIDESASWTPEEIQNELDNNAQGILGYVVRWVEQGIGCSKVPDINNVDLMEDRATLRISSQHMANWLHNGIVTKDQIIQSMEKMAKVVDQQNAGDPNYTPMAPDFDNSVAYQAALELVLDGINQPSGYTEPILHRRRLEYKAKNKK